MMKKILLIMIAVAWVGLSTYPAYADNGKKEIKTEQQVQPEEKESKCQPTEDKKDGENGSPNKSSENESSSVASGGDMHTNKTKINEFNLVITISVGILLLLVIFLLFKLFKQDKALRELYHRVNRDILPDLESIKYNVNEVKNQKFPKLSEKVETLNTDIRNLFDVLEQDKQQAKTKQEVVVELVKPTFVEKVLYGKYVDVDNGFDKKYLNEVKEDADQCEIRLKSDHDATFSLLPGKSNTLLKEALNACDILEGDPESFRSYRVVEDGRLTLQDGIWQVRDKVKIKLM